MRFPYDSHEELKAEVAEVICAETPRAFSAVGHFYEDLSQVTDDDVRELVKRANQTILR